MKLKYIIGVLALLLIMVGTASAEEVIITFDEGSPGLVAGQILDDAYVDLGVTFVGAKVVDTDPTSEKDLGFTPTNNVCTIIFSPYVSSVSIDFENAIAGDMTGVLVNGQKISDFNWFWQGSTLHIESSTQNPITSVKLGGFSLFCRRIEFDNLRYDQIPEFPTMAAPIAAIMGLMFVFGRKKEE